MCKIPAFGAFGLIAANAANRPNAPKVVLHVLLLSRFSNVLSREVPYAHLVLHSTKHKKGEHMCRVPAFGAFGLIAANAANRPNAQEGDFHVLLLSRISGVISREVP
jgi:hypothetical protein